MSLSRGWTAEITRQHETFCRLVVTDGSRSVLVDLAVDSAPGRKPTASFLGPTFSPEELAGRKTIALFDRAEARDFVDVRALAARFGKEQLLAWAAEVDLGFEQTVFVQMLGTLARFDDDLLAGMQQDVVGLREFFAQWARELRDG